MYKEVDTRSLMGEAKFYESYSRWNENDGRYETWNEAVERVMNMHRSFYANKMTDELENLISEAESLYKKKYFLGSQRALQFGGDQILKHHMRMYNCTSSYADRVAFFGEIFYILLCGAGAGFSVQKHHIEKLPEIQPRKGQLKTHIIDDSIEGWATSLDVLLSSFFIGGGKHPEYEGRRVFFDRSKIRQKGSMISGGFKAPGPEPLIVALDKIEHLLQGLILKGVTKLTPLIVYDTVMHAADAVLSGGVRRSATICLFSPDDQEMINAKTGDWFNTNPQRGRSNNSAVFVRDKTTKDEFLNIMKSIKEFGEPGFVFVESEEHAYNPCVEIGMYPTFRDASNQHISGWQGCNLAEINGSKCTNLQEFLSACRGASILSTLQAGYTDFKFIDPISKSIFDREALIGVSITGWMNSPKTLFNEDNLKLGADLIKETNRKVAAIININPAARTTCVKPSGNASVLLGTSSGIHGDHSERYLRNVQMTKDTEIADVILETNPYMVEESLWSQNNSDYVVSYPVIPPSGTIFKDQLYGIKLLEKVKFVQGTWVEFGTDESLSVDPTVRHNVSNTVQVSPDDWDNIGDYVYDNRKYFSGISFIGINGDRAYVQAPFTSVKTEKQIMKEYGAASLFASGLIVDTFKGFRSLWEAISISKSNSITKPGELNDMRADWTRRFRKFATNYFDNDLDKTEACLKDVYLLHKWIKIQQNYQNVDLTQALIEKREIDIDTMGAMACVGGACEI